MPPPDAVTEPVVHVLVVGGGNAGISLAAYLRRESPELTVALVAPEAHHTYRPLLSYVGGGMARLRRIRRAQRRVVPRGVRWHQDEVVRLLPGEQGRPHTIETAGGLRLQAEDLVLCPGTRMDLDALPGLAEALQTEHASTNYAPELAPRTWRMLRDLRAGRAVFAISARNTPCPGVGLKPLFLAADHWRAEGRLDDIEITVVMEQDAPTGLPRANRRIVRALEELGATVHRGARLGVIDAGERTLRFTASDGRGHAVGYDALHVAPPYRGHDWVVEAGVTDPRTALVATSPLTLAHPDHPGLWALGDAATLGTPSSGGGLRSQVPVVAHNIVARRTGGAMREYDGYTVVPLPLDRRRGLLAEWDRRGRESRTVPLVSLARPLRAVLWFDLWVQPRVYWWRLLRGRGLDEG